MIKITRTQTSLAYILIVEWPLSLVNSLCSLKGLIFRPAGFPTITFLTKQVLWGGQFSHH